MKTTFERGYRRDEDVEIDVTVINETEFAVLVNDGDIEAWVPKSEIKDYSEVPHKDTTITIPEWLAIEKGFI